MDIQYLAVFGNSARKYQDAAALVRRTITDKADSIEICTPFYSWQEDYELGIKFFWNLDDRGVALEEDQAIQLIDQWKKAWPSSNNPK